MDDAIYREIFTEPRWYRWVDTVVILIIGLLAGATLTYAIVLYRAEAASGILPSSTSGNRLPNGVKIEQV